MQTPEHSESEAQGRRRRRYFALQERFEHGNFSIGEVCELKGCCRSKFYADKRAGVVSIVKNGRRSNVPGPVAKRYIDLPVG
jgi:hypothetical protein